MSASSVLEFGSGQSTLFYADRAKHVVAVNRYIKRSHRKKSEMSHCEHRKATSNMSISSIYNICVPILNTIW
eukprot:SAG31_NODE_95_length_25901_cov_24.763700_19_plen_72_part_00